MKIKMKRIKTNSKSRHNNQLIMVSRTMFNLCLNSTQFYFILVLITSNLLIRSVSSASEYKSTTPMVAESKLDYLKPKTTKLNIVTSPYDKNFTSTAFLHQNSSNFSDNSNESTKYGDTENSTFNVRMGNELWDSLISQCYKRPTFSCLQKNIFTYLDNTLNISDVNVTNRLLFIKNKVDFTKYTREANQPKSQIKVKTYQTDNNNRIDDDISANDMKNDDVNDHLVEDNEIPDESRSADSPLEEVTNALYGKTVKFAMTHDIELKLPDMMFDGATFKISPRSMEGNGAIVKLELIPKTEIEEKETGRIFKKKIQNFFKNKLLLSFLAILLVIKLIKIKLFWLLPVIVGVGAAKKLLLKVLLFLFPALAHIFKLCNYYHNNYHQTKFHQHHHLINHHHTVSPPWANEYSVTLPNGPELIFTQPPKGHPPEFIHGPQQHQLHQHFNNDWESSGPGLGSDYISENINRNGNAESTFFRPKLEDGHDIRAWGLANGHGTTHSPLPHSYNVNPFLPESQSLINHKIRLSAGNPVYVAAHKASPPITIVTAVPNAAQIAAQYDPTINQQAVHRTQAQVKEALRIQAEQRLIAHQQKILQQQPFVQDGQPLMPKGYDPFYTPLLEKMDKIFLQLGFESDYCKERLTCSMYKNPSRYSPHSNFISAELSKDPAELQKPTETNQSVVKFYRLVQAARDGQEQRDCLRLHPQCSINTE